VNQVLYHLGSRGIEYDLMPLQETKPQNAAGYGVILVQLRKITLKKEKVICCVLPETRPEPDDGR
jgi:hypothetical protein